MIHTVHSMLSQGEINDLRWYLERADAEVSGMRSPPMVRQQRKQDDQANVRAFYSELRCGPVHVGAQDHGAVNKDIDDRRVSAVVRERRVRRAIEGLARREREMLFRCFAIELLDAREIYGRYGNIADMTTSAVEAHRAARTPRPLVTWLDQLGRRLRHASAGVVGFTAHLAIMTESRDAAKRVAEAYSRGRFLAAA